MPYNAPHRIKTITEYHRLMGLPKPVHPQISFVNLDVLKPPVDKGLFTLVFDFYSIALKTANDVKFRYGQTTADFDEGTLFFTAPGQLIGIDLDEAILQRPTGWIILFHPDLLWNTQLVQITRSYEFFNYSVNEALQVSEREEILITGMAVRIEHEYQGNIDEFTQDILIAQLEVLLNHAKRFYKRQFITRKVVHHEILTRLEKLLLDYFTSGELSKQGLPSVIYLAEKLNISPGYLSSLLRSITGQNTQQLLHEKIIELAKDKLTSTNLSVSEISYELGFEHLQSFSKLFKKKTNLSPLEFRHALN